MVCAEQGELERVKAACDAVPEVGEDEDHLAEQVARIKSPFSGLPTLLVCDALVDALNAPRAEARIRVGYFTEEAQPSLKDAVHPK